MVFLVLFLSNLLLAQQNPSGIKILLKDRETGFPFINDSMIVFINDSIKSKFKSDNNGYVFFNLKQGRYTIQIGHIGYQSQRMTGIMVGEAKTAYVTLELSNGKGEKIKEKKKKGGVKLKMKKN